MRSIIYQIEDPWQEEESYKWVVFLWAVKYLQSKNIFGSFRGIYQEGIWRILKVLLTRSLKQVVLTLIISHFPISSSSFQSYIIWKIIFYSLFALVDFRTLTACCYQYWTLQFWLTYSYIISGWSPYMIVENLAECNEVWFLQLKQEKGLVNF